MKNQCVMRIVTLFAVQLLGTTTWAASRYKLLHTFRDKPAAEPCSTLISDPAGNLYGTTCTSESRASLVYELSPTSNGGWVYQVIHVFTGGEGNLPLGGLLLDTAGNLYGTTYQGRRNVGCGVVYELMPSSGGRWKAKTLHIFTGRDGCNSESGLAMDAQGNLYGGTRNGGTYNDGVVYSLTLGSTGKWTARVLHNFSAAEGYGVQTGLVFDPSGKLYGATDPEVFVLVRNSGGGWTESLAYTFRGDDGDNPSGNLVFDAEGNLYGANNNGGRNGGGTVFKLTPNRKGSWTSTVLTSFPNNRRDGYWPVSGVTLDSGANVYGTTIGGGTHNQGVVFKLTPQSNSKWTETLLHTFTGGRDGNYPGGVTLDASHNLYGTGTGGGLRDCLPSRGCGVVFEIIPLGLRH
jgi:uncharacterized repeat protein (TIGR03803 family)